MIPGFFSAILLSLAALPATGGSEPSVDGMVERPAHGSFFSKHKDNYFVSGGLADEVKFQFSFKAQLLTYDAKHKSDSTGVYFAYTQKSLWDLWDIAGSSPFVENNYAPEFFVARYFQQQSQRTISLHGVKQLHYRLGFEHESNGEAAAGSRSWNKVYAAYQVGFFSGDWYTIITPQLYLPMGLADNPDIANYLGYGKLSFVIGHDRLATKDFGGLSIGATLTQGKTDFSRPGLSTVGLWRLGTPGSWARFSLGFAPALYAQWFEGYGETMLSYNQYKHTLRVGFSLEDRFADPRTPSY